MTSSLYALQVEFQKDPNLSFYRNGMISAVAFILALAVYIFIKIFT